MATKIGITVDTVNLSDEHFDVAKSILSRAIHDVMSKATTGSNAILVDDFDLDFTRRTSAATINPPDSPIRPLAR